MGAGCGVVVRAAVVDTASVRVLVDVIVSVIVLIFSVPLVMSVRAVVISSVMLDVPLPASMKTTPGPAAATSQWTILQ